MEHLAAEKPDIFFLGVGRDQIESEHIIGWPEDQLQLSANVALCLLDV